MPDVTTIPAGVDPQIWQQLINASGGWGPEANQSDPEMVSTFQQQFQNLTGQAPTADQINQFLSQAAIGLAGQAGTPTYGDMSNLTQAYIQQNYPQQVQQTAQQNQMSSLNSIVGQATPLINNEVATQAKNLTDPNSPTYQSFSGMLNNLGITPSSGAFQSGLGGTLGSSASSDIQSLMSSLISPALGTAQGASSQPYNQMLGQIYPSLGALSTQNINQNNFQEQSNLAQQVAATGQPSGFASDIGMASGSAGGVGSLLSGGAQAYKATWICTAMRKAGVLTQEEVDKLHNHEHLKFHPHSSTNHTETVKHEQPLPQKKNE